MCDVELVCDASKLSSERLDGKVTLQKLMHWLNEIHRWGCTVRARGYWEDCKALSAETIAKKEVTDELDMFMRDCERHNPPVSRANER